MSKESFKINDEQLKRLHRSLGKTQKVYKKALKNMFSGLGVYITGLAKEYCPESPTKADYARQNKSGTTARNNIFITTGALRDSIEFDTTPKSVSIGVPDNTPASRYAIKMHDEKGRSWRNRGPRTVKKGSKADEKFVFRAYDDSTAKQEEIIDVVIKSIEDSIGI